MIRRDAQRKQKKLHSVSRDDTTVNRHAKRLYFEKNHKKLFNQLIFVS